MIDPLLEAETPKIFLLSRSSPKGSAAKRALDAFNFTRSESERITSFQDLSPAEIEVLDGDISLPGLGLEKRTIDEVRSEDTLAKKESPDIATITKELQMIDASFEELDKNFASLSETQKERRTSTLMNDLLIILDSARKAGVDENVIRGLLPSTYTIKERSPFIKRLREWPAGHPGDYVTIDMLVNKEGAGDEGTFSGYLGHFILESQIAQQHREKLKIQSDLITKTCQEHPGSTIVSIGCGSAKEMIKNIPAIRESGMRVVLVDSDPNALKAAFANLHSLGDNLILEECNVVRYKTLIRRFLNIDKKKIHLIYMGGLLDYLAEKISKRLIQALSSNLLSEEGTIMFTNIAEGNPYRPLIEILANWVMITRSQSKMMDLLKETGIGQTNQKLYREPTGLTWIAQATKI